MLQYVAVCCNVYMWAYLLNSSLETNTHTHTRHTFSQMSIYTKIKTKTGIMSSRIHPLNSSPVAVCCSVLQHGVVRCSMLQCVAMYICGRTRWIRALRQIHTHTHKHTHTQTHKLSQIHTYTHKHTDSLNCDIYTEI